MSAPERNYASEALGILHGQSRLLPQVEHLQAIAAQMEGVLQEHKVLSDLLAAAMVDTGQTSLYFPAEDLARVERFGLVLTITRHPRGQQGAVMVELARRGKPAAASARVS